MIVFLRRKGLGAGSIKGMTSLLEGGPFPPSTVSPRLHLGDGVSVVRNDRLNGVYCPLLGSESNLLVRWGCTAPTDVPLASQVNTSLGIKTVNNKRQFRLTLQENNPELVPRTVVTDTAGTALYPSGIPLVLRPTRHAQGRNLFVCNGLEEVLNVVRQRPALFHEGWYASELIDKVAEYRVYVVSGMVATVAKKTPGDPSAVAWNVAQGGRFDVVPWGEWPMEAIRVALESFKYTNLDFGGVDVMVDGEGKAYCIEVNSAPSLPLLSDGSPSYRQQCMAKCFRYMELYGKDTITPAHTESWRGVIHPAIQGVEL